MKVNVHHAKTNLSKLILRAEAGEEVVIARDGKPVVKLVPVLSTSRRIFKPGALKGRLRVPSHFLAPAPEIEVLFEQEAVLPKRIRNRVAAVRKKREK